MTNRILGRAARVVRGMRKRTPMVFPAPQLALALRVEEVATLRRSLGPRLLDQLLGHLVARLRAELRLLPFPRPPEGAEICGILSDRRHAAIPALVTRLEVICRERIELGGIAIRPIINAVIVCDETGEADHHALVEFGRQMLATCSPLNEHGQIRFVEFAGASQKVDPTIDPWFAPDDIELRYQPQLCCETGRVIAMKAVAQLHHQQAGMMDLDELLPRLDAQMRADVTSTMVKRALAQMPVWEGLGVDLPRVSITLGDSDLGAERLGADHHAARGGGRAAAPRHGPGGVLPFQHGGGREVGGPRRRSAGRPPAAQWPGRQKKTLPVQPAKKPQNRVPRKSAPRP